MENNDIYQKHINILIQELKGIFTYHNIDPCTFTMLSNPENKPTHEQILNLLSQCIKSLENQLPQYEDVINNLKNKSLKHAYSFITQGISVKSLEKNIDYKLSQLIFNYFHEFYGLYYTFENGKVVRTNSEDFTLPSIEDKPDFESNKIYINKKIGYAKFDNKELCLIIMPSGKCYYAHNDHQTLAHWLTVNGFNLQNAIRFESSQDRSDFNFTSLNNYRLSTDSNEDDLIELSHRQAEILNILYGSLIYSWYYLEPLSSQLKNTTGFGFGKTEEFNEEGLGGKNLNRIHLHMGNYFNKNEYVRELRLNNDAHNPIQ